jgi:hypothetical protein
LNKNNEDVERHNNEIMNGSTEDCPDLTDDVERRATFTVYNPMRGNGVLWM